MGRSLRLLVVEDHVDSAELLAELLELHGHSVRIATNASAAIELANAHAFDIVLTDVGLPDASGYELMRQLRTRYAMKGIAVTGRAEDVQLGRDAGFSVHLTKPVSLQKLRLALETVASAL